MKPQKFFMWGTHPNHPCDAWAVGIKGKEFIQRRNGDIVVHMEDNEPITIVLAGPQNTKANFQCYLNGEEVSGNLFLNFHKGSYTGAFMNHHELNRTYQDDRQLCFYSENNPTYGQDVKDLGERAGVVNIRIYPEINPIGQPGLRPKGITSRGGIGQSEESSGQEFTKGEIGRCEIEPIDFRFRIVEKRGGRVLGSQSQALSL